MLTVNSLCPQGLLEETFETLRSYVINHQAPGSFLTNILSDSLMEAVLSANPDSRFEIPALCEYIFHHCPGDCWGSPQAVEGWINTPNTNYQRLRLVE